ncbi:uncharacterized protein BDZ99DRAFT_480142 [Mytilinidion resinicola]|uniref:Uncharacterized protein n=1 Tax=Mytilinidion resinicola TaxID=574789 RepID=A0A6A6Y9B9_9PEZI|nr:uncharacterized protein BDZ99DRAFT_480142 [Mytilinidion resinicola]KAF2805412.1 hypothetical protein BDZ99DRAFT_480142 [Mytilinidion resinicola]
MSMLGHSRIGLVELVSVRCKLRQYFDRAPVGLCIPASDAYALAPPFASRLTSTRFGQDRTEERPPTQNVCICGKVLIKCGTIEMAIRKPFHQVRQAQDLRLASQVNPLQSVIFIVFLMANLTDCLPLAVKKTQHLTLMQTLAIIFPTFALVLGILAFIFGFKMMKRWWLRIWEKGWFRRETPAVRSPALVQGPTVVLPPPAPIPVPSPVMVPGDHPGAVTIGNDGRLRDWISFTAFTEEVAEVQRRVETEAEEWEIERRLSPRL